MTDKEFWELINNISTVVVFLVLVDYYNPATKKVETLYISNIGFVTSPTDTIPNIAFNSVVEVSLHQLVTDLKPTNPTTNVLSAQVDTNINSLNIINPNGMYDYLTDCILDGYKISMYLGTKDLPFSEFKKIKSLVAMNAVIKSETAITINFKSFDAVFDRESQNRIINVGVSSGKPQPIAYGTIFRATPIYLGINTKTGFKRYKVNEFPILEITRVTDNGVGINPNNVVKYLQMGEFELKIEPAGTLAVDFKGTVESDGVTLVETTGKILKHFIKNKCGDVAINEESFTKYDADVPDKLGIYVLERINMNELIDKILESTLGFKYFNSLDEVVIKPFRLITSTDPVEITPEVIINSSLSQKDTLILPVATTKVAFAMNYTQSEQVALSLSETERQLIRQKHSIANSGIVVDELYVTKINPLNAQIAEVFFQSSPTTPLDLSKVKVKDYLVCYLGVQSNNQGYFEITEVKVSTIIIKNTNAVLETSISAPSSILAYSELYEYMKNPINTTVKETFLVSKADAIKQCSIMLALHSKVRKIYSMRIANISVNFSLLQHVRLTHSRYGLANGVDAWVIGAPDITFGSEIAIEVLV